MLLPPLALTLFPYTTLFRSVPGRSAPCARASRRRAAPPAAPPSPCRRPATTRGRRPGLGGAAGGAARRRERSEEHTSELQSRVELVCRLLLEKKKTIKQQSA